MIIYRYEIILDDGLQQLRERRTSPSPGQARPEIVNHLLPTARDAQDVRHALGREVLRQRLPIPLIFDTVMAL
jgi:hypothetical protein